MNSARPWAARVAENWLGARMIGLYQMVAAGPGYPVSRVGRDIGSRCDKKFEILNFFQDRVIFHSGITKA